jgi:hypothetical protein
MMFPSDIRKPLTSGGFSLTIFFCCLVSFPNHFEKKQKPIESIEFFGDTRMSLTSVTTGAPQVYKAIAI